MAALGHRGRYRKASDQKPGISGADGKPLGRNGIVIWKADNVSVENLTVCNSEMGLCPYTPRITGAREVPP